MLMHIWGCQCIFIYAGMAHQLLPEGTWRKSLFLTIGKGCPKKTAEDLESSNFLQKPFHKLTKRLMSQNFKYPNVIILGLIWGWFGADLWGKMA